MDAKGEFNYDTNVDDKEELNGTPIYADRAPDNILRSTRLDARGEFNYDNEGGATLCSETLTRVGAKGKFNYALDGGATDDSETLTNVHAKREFNYDLESEATFSSHNSTRRNCIDRYDLHSKHHGEQRAWENNRKITDYFTNSGKTQTDRSEEEQAKWNHSMGESYRLSAKARSDVNEEIRDKVHSSFFWSKNLKDTERSVDSDGRMQDFDKTPILMGGDVEALYPSMEPIQTSWIAFHAVQCTGYKSQNERYWL